MTKQVLKEDEVDLIELDSLDNDDFNTIETEDGRAFFINFGGSGWIYEVEVAAEEQFIKISTHLSLLQDVSRLTKLEFANRNQTTAFSALSITDAGDLLVTYQMTYAGGLRTKQFLTVHKKMDSFVLSLIGTCDTEKLLAFSLQQNDKKMIATMIAVAVAMGLPKARAVSYWQDAK